MIGNSSKVARKQTGFTLLELVVVIVLLGILGVTALSKFTDLSSDAEIAVLEYTGGAMLSAANLTYANAIVQGVQGQALANVDVDGDGIDDVELVYGYPSGSGQDGIPNVMGGSFASDWAYANTFGGSQFWVTKASNTGFSGYTNNNIPISQAACFARYRPPSAPGEAPTIDYVTSGC